METVSNTHRPTNFLDVGVQRSVSELTYLALDELVILLLCLEIPQPDKLRRVTNSATIILSPHEATHASPSFSNPLLRLTDAMSSKCLFPGSYTRGDCMPRFGLGMLDV